MMMAMHSAHATVVSAVLLVTAFACSSTPSAPAAGCGDGVAVADGCVGVASTPVCGDAVCTGGIACAMVLNATSDGELADAISKAGSGDCIALSPGTYGDAVLPAGVSLLGRSAKDVHLHHVAVGAGSSATVRGLEVGAGGLAVADGALGVRLDSILVDGTDADGVLVGANAQVAMTQSTVADAGVGNAKGANGINAPKGADLTVDHTLIRNAHGPGLWVQATGDACGGAGAAKLAAHGIIIQGAQLVGMSLVGTSALLGDVTVTGTLPYAPTGMYGGGISVSACSAVTSDGTVTASSNAAFGVLVDHSAATLGGSDGTSLAVTGNKVHGVWIQNVTAAQGVTLTNLVADDNAGVAIGLDGSSQGIIIQGKSEALRTSSRALPAFDGKTASVQQVGDGLSWNAGVQAKIDGLALHGNARSDMLVSGQWANGSSAANLGVTDGDTHTIIIQGLSGNQLLPGMESVPSNLVSESPTVDFAVATAPQAPPVM